MGRVTVERVPVGMETEPRVTVGWSRSLIAVSSSPPSPASPVSTAKLSSLTMATRDASAPVGVGRVRLGAVIEARDAVARTASISLMAEEMAPRLAEAVGKVMLGSVTEWASALMMATSSSLKAEEKAARLALAVGRVKLGAVMLATLTLGAVIVASLRATSTSLMMEEMAARLTLAVGRETVGRVTFFASALLMAAPKSLMAEENAARVAVGTLVPGSVIPGMEIPENVNPGTVLVGVASAREGTETDAVLIAASTSLRAEEISARLMLAVGSEMLGNEIDSSDAVLRASASSIKAEEIAAALTVGMAAVGRACSSWLTAVETSPNSPPRAVASTPPWLLTAVLTTPVIGLVTETGDPTTATGLKPAAGLISTGTARLL